MFILSGTLINILKPRKAKRKKAKVRRRFQIANPARKHAQKRRKTLIWSN